MDEKQMPIIPGPGFSSSLPFPRGYQTPSPGFSEWQLDPKDVLEIIEHALRGEFWDTTEKAWITASHKEMIYKDVETYDAVLKKNVVKQIRVPSDKISDKAKRVNPLLNENGIHDILRDIASRVHRVIIMSNFTEKQLNDWLWDIGHELAAKLFEYKNDWDIPDITAMDTIHTIVMVNTDATMRRALLEGERRRLYEATKTTEQIVYEREQQKSRLAGIPIIGGLAR